MARPDMIAAYLERLAAEARVRGLDPERLVSEVADHLATASAREGQARALAAFGDAASIARDVACKRGVTMRITIRRAAAVLGRGIVRGGERAAAFGRELRAPGS